MSCLACKIYEQSAWQAMTGPFIPHQLVASQQELGTERLFLISARTPAPEIFALRPAGKLTSPPCEAQWRRERLFCDGDPWSAHWATPLAWFTSPPTALSPHSALWVQVPQPAKHSHPSGGTHTAETDGHLDLHLRSQISTYERNPVVNKPSGPSSALGLQLGLQHLLSYLALLISGPAWTIIPGGTAWKSHRVLSIYNQMMPTQIFTWYLTCAVPVLLRSGFDCERILQKAEDSLTKQVWFLRLTGCLSAEHWHVHLNRTLNVSWERLCTNTNSGVAGQVGLGSSLRSNWG